MHVTTDALNSPAVAVLCTLEHAGLDLAVVGGRLRVWPVERLTAGVPIPTDRAAVYDGARVVA